VPGASPKLPSECSPASGGTAHPLLVPLRCASWVGAVPLETGFVVEGFRVLTADLVIDEATSPVVKNTQLKNVTDG